MYASNDIACHTSDFRQLFLSDPGAAFAKQIGWTLGERTGRFAMVIDNSKVLYAENEPGKGLTVSSAEDIIKFLETI